MEVLGFERRPVRFGTSTFTQDVSLAQEFSFDDGGESPTSPWREPKAVLPGSTVAPVAPGGDRMAADIIFNILPPPLLRHQAI